VSTIKVNRIENTSTTDGGVSIDTSGKVGIGSTSIDGMLHVKGASTHGSLILEAGGTSGLTNQMFIQGHNNAGNSIGEINFAETATNQGALLFYTNGGSLTEKARIDSSGRLLVGTSTSISNLYRATTSAVSPTLQIENATNNYNSGYSNINYSASGFAPVLTLGLSKSNTQGTNTVVASGDELGYIHFVGADGTNFRSAAWIKGEVDGTPGSGDMPGRLVFSTSADGASSPTERMRIDSAGSVVLANASAFVAAYIYNTTTASAANAVVVDASGFLRRSVSSIKYKENVQDATHGLTELLQLRSVTYTGKSEADGATVFGGLIAEEVDAAGLSEFVHYAEDGSPSALAYGNMVSLCVKAIQEQQTVIEELQTKVAALEGV